MAAAFNINVTGNNIWKGKGKVKGKEMDKVRFQVLGYRNFNKKADGKPLTVLTAFYQCTPQDNERGSYGMKSTDFFLPDNKVGTLTPDCVGKEFVPQYGINGFGKPMLEDFTFKEWKA